MAVTTTGRGSAPTRRLRPWLARLVLRRARAQWQLVVVVTAIAVLACTIISSLALLVAATELGAVRGALTSASASESEIRTTLTKPAPGLVDDRATLEAAAATVLGDAATSTSQSLALSGLYSVTGPGVDPLIYLGEFDDIDDNTVLTIGSWPSEHGQVALSTVGAEALGVTVGDTVTGAGPLKRPDLDLTVSGIFRVEDADSTYWAGDLLHGDGLDPLFPVPGTGGSFTTDAIGPLVVAPGTFDDDGTVVERFVLRTTPDFTTTEVDQLPALQSRLNTVSESAPALIGDIADVVKVKTDLTTLIGSVTAAMAVTRTTVVVVSLLLLTLAVAALAQAARLLTEARLGERHLMRARGAAGRAQLGLGALESALIALLTAALSPVLARGVYVIIAQQPAMVASGMPGDPGVPPLVVAAAALVAGLFWLVLVAPAVGREGSFHEGEQGKARERRLSGAQRSGVDVALLILAGVAYWQLLSYKGPSSGSTTGVDPVLVAGPALVLLAGAFLAVRLIPAAAVITERLAERSTGVVVALASWEVGRRAQKATAAILLLTLALAVGTFSHAFLATWRQSQIDQAAFALGAPMRLTAGESAVEVPVGAQAVIRSPALLASPDQRVNRRLQGEESALVALTGEARDMLRVGRLGTEGGTVIADSLESAVPIEAQIDLPDSTAGLSAVVRVSTAEPLDGVGVRLRMLVQDKDDNQTLLDLGVVPVDGDEYSVRALLPFNHEHDGLSIIGYQAVAFVLNPANTVPTPSTPATLLIGELGSLRPALIDTPLEEYDSVPVTSPTIGAWRTAGYGGDTIDRTYAFAPPGWQLGIAFTLPWALGSEAVSVSQIGWPVAGEISAVLSGPLAAKMQAKVTDRLTLVVNGIGVPIVIAGIAPAVPGGGSATTIGSLGGHSADIGESVVVDEELLARALFEAGVTEPAVREWWVDVTDSAAADYVADVATHQPDLAAQSAVLLGVQMQQNPLRVAVQGSLWLVIIGATALAAVGFAVHATGSLRARATEFAQLRAVGLSRRRLVGIIGIESLLLCVLGTVFGVGLGLLLAYLVVPLIGVSGDGSVPIPSVAVHIPGDQIGLLVAALAVVLALVVLIAAVVQRVAEPASALRTGDER